MTSLNIDDNEVRKFDNIADQWWNLHGEFKPLHAINPLRLNFILQHFSLANQHVLDVGCGGGILTESLAKHHAIVTGIDASAKAINVAKAHARSQNLAIDYQHLTAEKLAETQFQSYDAVTCMELLEHVPEPAHLIQACANLVKPDGYVFFSTINRTLKAYLLAVIGAEYILRWLPKGTHDYKKFIRPAELATWLRQANLNLVKMSGITYQPFTQQYQLSENIDINYLVCCQKC